MVEFADVILTAGKQRKRGSLSFASASSATLDFQPRASNSKVRIALADVAALTWWQQFDGFVLRVEMRGGTTVKFSQLKEDAWQHVSALCKHHTLPISKQSISTKGTNAQQLQVTGQTAEHTHRQQSIKHVFLSTRRPSTSSASTARQTVLAAVSERRIHMMSEIPLTHPPAPSTQCSSC